MILHGASAQADARNSTDMYGSDRFQALYPTHHRRKFKRSCLSSKSQSSSPHIRSVEAISGIIGWTAQWAEALTHPLRFLHLQLKGSGTLIDLLQLSKMAIENSDDLSERIICLACLAESRRCIIDLFNHGSQILAHFVQSLGQFAGDLVGSLPLLIGR